jgi:hypothetical protein
MLLVAYSLKISFLLNWWKIYNLTTIIGKYQIKFTSIKLNTIKKDQTLLKFKIHLELCIKDVEVYDGKLISDVKDSSFEPFVDRITVSILPKIIEECNNTPHTAIDNMIT